MIRTLAERTTISFLAMMAMTRWTVAAGTIPYPVAPATTA
jgi:hypothetical protein